jgi:hypothetical protein
MTKNELIALLESIPGDPEVLIFDPEEDEWMPVTGGTHDELELKLYSDVDGDEGEDEP